MQLTMPLPWPNVVLIIANIFSLSGDIAVMLTCFLVWMDDAPDTGTTERARISKCNFEMQVHCLPCLPVVPVSGASSIHTRKHVSISAALSRRPAAAPHRSPDGRRRGSDV